MFAIYLGGIRVYETADAAALERGGLTPIVVDFVYRRRVAEVLLDFVLVTVSYYAAYRLKFDFIEFAANFTYFTQSLPVVVAVQLAAFFAVGVYQGVWRHFSASDAVTVVRGALTSTILSALIFAYLFRDDPATPQIENYSSTVLDHLCRRGRADGHRIAGLVPRHQRCAATPAANRPPHRRLRCG